MAKLKQRVKYYAKKIKHGHKIIHVRARTYRTALIRARRKAGKGWTVTTGAYLRSRGKSRFGVKTYVFHARRRK